MVSGKALATGDAIKPAAQCFGQIHQPK